MRPIAPPRTLVCLLFFGIGLVGPIVMPQIVVAQGSELTLKQIMRNPEWLGRAPQRPYWNWDSESIYFFRRQPTVDGVDPRRLELHHQQLDATSSTLVEPQQLGEVDPPRTTRNQDQSLLTYQRDGDIFLRSLTAGEGSQTTQGGTAHGDDGDQMVESRSPGDLHQITRTTDRETRPFFLTDGRLAFSRGNHAVYARDLDTGLEEQLFAVNDDLDPDTKLANERKSRDYIAREEERLLGWVHAEQKRAGLRRDFEKAREQDQSTASAPWYIGEKTSIRSLSPSPDARLALVVVTKKAPRPKGNKMAAYVSTSGTVEIQNVRPTVGTVPQASDRLLLLDRATRQQIQIDLDDLPSRRDDPLSDLRKAAEERKKALEEEESPGANSPPKEQLHDATQSPDKSAVRKPKNHAKNGDEKSVETQEQKPRPVVIGPIEWSTDGEFAVLQLISRDNKDRWIVQLSWPRDKTPPPSPADRQEKAAKADGDLEPLVRVVHHQHDAAWINWSFRDFGIVPRTQQIYFLSEQSGWSHLYLSDRHSEGTSTPTEELTHGQFVVDSPTPSSDGTAIFFTSNQLHPGRTEVYRIDLESRQIDQVTDLGGLNDFSLSPDDSKLLISHSTTTRPPEVYVQDAQPGAEPYQLTHTISEEFLAIDWVAPRVVPVPSSHHDRPIYSRLYLPKDPSNPSSSNSEELRPAVMFIHGAGYLQNAHLGWSGYFREFMFHTLLTQKGFVVLDMDYRASKGYGRDWRTAIYRQMGWPEVEDLEDGVRYLVDSQRVDRTRVGVYGGSYGGFLTFMAMFNQPDLFAAGAALRPVTDWAHYNHGYTSNILNTPELDPDAYKRSSPIEYADGLQKPLLIATGVLDDNVFFQDSVRLVQRLIELEKRNWEIAIYPVEHHGFREPSSWLDEYRRILNLFEQNLKTDQ